MDGSLRKVVSKTHAECNKEYRWLVLSNNIAIHLIAIRSTFYHVFNESKSTVEGEARTYKSTTLCIAKLSHLLFEFRHPWWWIHL